MNRKFRNLKAEEIQCRIGTISEKGLSLLLYKDSRADMDILDETVGPENWMRDHKELKGNMYCGVGIWDEEKGLFVWKWDCGAESNTEAEKGEASDSFKRACVNWGIGRELYSAPFIWISSDKYEQKMNAKNKPTTYDKFYVKKLTYIKDKDNNDTKQIDALDIVRVKGNTETPVFVKMPTQNVKKGDK